MGYIYLLQPAELVGTDRYKIGISSKSNLNRLRSYGLGTRYMFFMECENYMFIEDKLKESFKKCGYLKCIKGREYYQGEESVVMKEFLTIVFRYNIESYIGDTEKSDSLSELELKECQEKKEDNFFKEKINKFKYSK
jgi:hypothetical protein